MADWVWALNDRGYVTKCYSPKDKRGEGRCNHIFFQNDGEGEIEFIRRVTRKQQEIERRHAMTVKQQYQLVRTSSKGVQDKWYDDEKQLFYKCDSEIHEGLHEELVSMLLDGSNLPHVKYCTCFISGPKFGKIGCYSINFLQDGQNEVKLKDLLGLKVMQKMVDCDDIKIAYRLMVKTVAEKTGIEESVFDLYLKMLISSDIITGNHDRHVDNITLWERNGLWELAHAFDYGCGFDNSMDEGTGEWNSRLCTFMRRGKTMDESLYTTRDYLSLFAPGKPPLKLSQDVYDRVEMYENELYVPFEVKSCKRLLIRRLRETEGILWYRES